MDAETTQTMSTIHLEWGATLYGPADKLECQPIQQPDMNESFESVSSLRNLSRENYLDRYVPTLKARSVAAHLLQQGIPASTSALVDFLGEDDTKQLINSLEKSRTIAHQLSQDEDLAHAFQEAWRSEWGDGVLEVERALAAMGGSNNHRGGSEMFFFAQEAGSSMAIVHVLSLLYCKNNKKQEIELGSSAWDGASYAEPILFERILGILGDFLESEAKDGHLIDPNWWKNTNENGGKIVLHCKSFVGVVICILEFMKQYSKKQFERQKGKLFPLLCSLVKVQSEQIRELVCDILRIQVSPLLGISSR